MKTVTEAVKMKRRLGIAAVAAASALTFAQGAFADSYDFWTASTPKRAESQAASPRATPAAAESAWEEFNEVTAVAPKRAAAAQPAPAKPSAAARVERNAADFQGAADPYSAM